MPKSELTRPAVRAGADADIDWSTYVEIEDRGGVAACECPGNLLDAGRAFDSCALCAMGHKTSALSFLMSLLTVWISPTVLQQLKQHWLYVKTETCSRVGGCPSWMAHGMISLVGFPAHVPFDAELLTSSPLQLWANVCHKEAVRSFLQEEDANVGLVG